MISLYVIKMYYSLKKEQHKCL